MRNLNEMTVEEIRALTIDSADEVDLRSVHHMCAEEKHAAFNERMDELYTDLVLCCNGARAAFASGESIKPFIDAIKGMGKHAVVRAWTLLMIDGTKNLQFCKEVHRLLGHRVLDAFDVPRDCRSTTLATED